MVKKKRLLQSSAADIPVPPKQVRKEVANEAPTTSKKSPIAHPGARPRRQLQHLPRLKYECINPYYTIVILPPARSFLFFGWAGVTCLGGSVRIDGYDVKATSFDAPEKMLSVCAPAESGRPAIFQATTDDPLTVKEARLKFRLKEVSNEYERVLHDWRCSRAAILLFNRNAPVLIDLFTQLHPDRLYLTQYSWSPTDIDLLESPDWNLYRKSSMQDLEKVLAEVEAKRSEGGKMTLLPCGSKDAGKSTFIRYLTNRLLKSNLPLYVLDVDIGQPEFTPSGCMSLWRVTKPLLDSSWCHMKRDFEHCYFYGDVTPTNDVHKYKSIFISLLNEYKENSPPGSVLLINSLGWIEGPGLKALQYIVDCASPNYIFQLTGGGGQYRTAALTVEPDTNTIHIYRDLRLKEKDRDWEKKISKQPSPLRPPELRELRTIGYFSHLLSKPLMHLINEVRMYKIDFKDATIAIPEDLTVDDRYIFATLNLQLVALCSTADPIPVRRMLDREYLPNIYTISPEAPLWKCYGYGIINAVDSAKKQIVVISPISNENLSKVTVLVRGNRMTVPKFISRAPNGAQTMYTTGVAAATTPMHADLYGALIMDRQNKFYRQHFPSVE